MKILIKHTLSNIFKKPLRALIMIMCAAVTVVSSYLIFDMEDSINSSIRQYFLRMVGNCEVQISASNGIKDEYFEGVPEYKLIPCYITHETLFRRDKEQYSYVFTEEADIYGFDIEEACDMKIFESRFELKDDEILISEKYAEDCALKEGDTVVLHDKYNRDVQFTVKRIMTEKNLVTESNQYGAVVNLSAMNKLNAGEDEKPNNCFIDVKDNNKTDEFVDKVKENAPDVFCRNLSTVGEEGAAQIKSLFTIIFIISVLLVIFITISMSNRTVCERMSVIGTFRSLGISQRMTSYILLGENIMYGLIGASAGTLIYLPIREPVLSTMISFGDNSAPSPEPLKAYVFIIIFVCALLLECLAPAYALIKAVKTPIRDIIFDNKDTEYHFSVFRTAAGIIFLMIFIISLIFGNDKMLFLVVSLISLVVSVSLFMPYILKAGSVLLSSFAGKTKQPVLKLASNEICSKKSTVSSAVLCVTAVCLSVAIYVFSCSINFWIGKNGYNADVLLFEVSQKKSQISFVEDIDGVKDVDYMYYTNEKIEIDGDIKDDVFHILALPDKDFFDMIPDYPESLQKNEFVMNRKFADIYKIKKGDTVDFTFHAGGVFPKHVNLILEGYINTTDYSDGPVMIINEELYLEQYYDHPSGVLIKCDDPDGVLELIKAHSTGRTDNYYTQQSYKQKKLEDSSAFTGILSVLLVVGITLTIIGSSGNQIIGFEGRKREYAVMYSTSMKKGQLMKLIFLENFISTGCAVITAVLSSIVITKITERILDVIDFSVKVTAGIGTYAAAGCVFWIILMFTCISPMRSLRKMNIANELKYE